MRRWFLFLFVLMGFADLGSGCRGASVVVKAETYTPSLSKYLGIAYRNRAVHIPNAVNKAQNTSIWHYYSADRTLTYETSPSVDQYFTECVRKAAFSHMGMRVQTSESPGIPTVRFTLLHWDNQRLVVQADILANEQLVFSQQYQAVSPPVTNAHPMTLQVGASYQINYLLNQIFSSRPFFMAYYYKAAGIRTYSAGYPQPEGPAPEGTPSPEGAPPQGDPPSGPPPAGAPSEPEVPPPAPATTPPGAKGAQ